MSSAIQNSVVSVQSETVLCPEDAEQPLFARSSFSNHRWEILKHLPLADFKSYTLVCKAFCGDLAGERPLTMQDEVDYKRHLSVTSKFDPVIAWQRQRTDLDHQNRNEIWKAHTVRILGSVPEGQEKECKKVLKQAFTTLDHLIWSFPKEQVPKEIEALIALDSKKRLPAFYRVLLGLYLYRLSLQLTRFVPEREIPNITAALAEISALIPQKLFSKEEYQALLAFCRARDTLVVWLQLAKNIAAPPNFGPAVFSSAASMQTQAEQFSAWINQNRQAIAARSSLRLVGIQLSTLPEELCQLTSILALNIAGNSLCMLPADIGQLPRLRRINLNNNQFTKFPPELCQLTNLEDIEFTGNPVSTISNRIGHLLRLRSLNFGDNKLSTLPPNVGQLSGLESLRLHGNQFCMVPDAIGELRTLTHLSFSKNQLLLAGEAIGRLNNLRKFDLSDNNLQTLSTGIGELTNLEELCLRGNQLQELPTTIGRLKNLKRLDVTDNKLSLLPYTFRMLTNLRDLQLGGNQLSKLRGTMGKFTKLFRLDLSNNNLSNLNGALRQLTNLQYLYLSGNQLSKIPADFGRLTCLSHLFLNRNQISKIPATLSKLRLTSLDISYNSLHYQSSLALPVSGLRCAHNPFNATWEDVLALQALRTYLFVWENWPDAEELVLQGLRTYISVLQHWPRL